MKINITGRHFELSDAIRSYAIEKLERIEKFYSNITKIEVILKGEDRTFHCETITHISNKPSIVINVSNESMYAAIDLAINKIQRQLKRLKGKLQEKRHDKSSKINIPVVEPDDDDIDESEI